MPWTRLHLALVLSTLVAAASCGGGSGGPDAAYADMCGPVRSDAGSPNTLLARIAGNTTLKKACSPYYIDDPVLLTATLTIEPGVQIIACPGGCRSRLTVATGGKVLATGTAEEPITFTSNYTGPIGGQWTGILFLHAEPGSHLEHVIIEYAGGPYTGVPSDDEFNRYEFPVEGALLNDSTPDLEVVDTWIRKTRGYAVAATTSEEFEQADDSIYAAFDRITLTENANSIWLPVDQGGTLGPDICWTERATDGTCPAGPGPADHYVELHVDDMLARTPENVHRDAIWKPFPIPYKVQNINITSDALLTILDGVEVRMTEYGGITVGLNEPGALAAVAATPGGIKITSFYDPPTPAQYWKGLYIWSFADSERTHIENVDLSYGGRQAPTATVAPGLITIFDASPTIVGNHVHESRGTGIYWSCASAPSGLEDPPLPSTNTSDDATLDCFDNVPSVPGIAENYGCACPGGGCESRCPNP